MIRIQKLKDYCQTLKVLIGADAAYYVVREDHLQKKLNGASGTFLAIVLPSAQAEGQADNLTDLNTVLLFVLQSFSKSEVTDTSELDQFIYLQDLALKVRDQLLADADALVDPIGLLDRASLAVDPEWNIASAYNGYSITLNFNDYVIG